MYKTLLITKNVILWDEHLKQKGVVLYSFIYFQILTNQDWTLIDQGQYLLTVQYSISLVRVWIDWSFTENVFLCTRTTLSYGKLILNLSILEEKTFLTAEQFILIKDLRRLERHEVYWLHRLTLHNEARSSVDLRFRATAANGLKAQHHTFGLKSCLHQTPSQELI